MAALAMRLAGVAAVEPNKRAAQAVDLRGYGFRVQWVATRSVAAKVINLQSAWDHPDRVRIGDPV